MTSLFRLSSCTLLACALATLAHAVPKPLRLYEVAVARFIQDDLGQHWLQRGLLDSVGRFQLESSSGVLESVHVPADVLGRYVITAEAWWAYERLGPEAVHNFVIDEATGMFLIGLREYYFVNVSPDPKLDVGDAVNLSARGHVASGADPLIGGFVIENQHRSVLIRGIGPTLSGFGVPEPVADPYIVIHKNGSQQFLLFNDDWSSRHDADRIEEISAQVGAFTLPRGSKDAAYLVELAPGAYTVHLGTDGAAGTGLLEIYVVP